MNEKGEVKKFPDLMENIMAYWDCPWKAAEILLHSLSLWHLIEGDLENLEKQSYLNSAEIKLRGDNNSRYCNIFIFLWLSAELTAVNDLSKRSFETFKTTSLRYSFLIPRCVYHYPK